MSRMDARYIALLGKLINKYDVMSDIKDFDDLQRDLLRNALTEYNFYHSHERVEAGTTPNIDAIKESTVNQAREREKLRLKTTR